MHRCDNFPMSDNFRLKRRFIAGAVCPECQEMDKVVMYDDQHGRRWRECVSCGFQDEMPEVPTPEELNTRVNQARVGEKPLAHEDEVSVVNILDPKAVSKSGIKRKDH